ncbi:MAG: hypothetical protein AAB692_00935 [Patescibacteria group bacterium]
MQRLRRFFSAFVLAALLGSIVSQYFDAVTRGSQAGFDPVGMAIVVACSLAIWFGWTLPASEVRRPMHEMLTGILVAATGALLAYDDMRKGKTPVAIFDLAVIGGFGAAIFLQASRRMIRWPKAKAKPKPEKKKT